MGMAGDGFWAMTMDWRKSRKVNIDDRWLSCLVSKIDFGVIRVEMWMMTLRNPGFDE